GRPAPRPAAPTGGSGPLAGRVGEGGLGPADPHPPGLVGDGQLPLEGRGRRGVPRGPRGPRGPLLWGRGPGGGRGLARPPGVPVAWPTCRSSRYTGTETRDAVAGSCGGSPASS